MSERERLQAFLADLQAVCAKHGCLIENRDEEGIGLRLAKAANDDLRLVTGDITATQAEAAQWQWYEDEQRIAGPPVDRRFAFTTLPDLPEGTPYMAKAWKREAL